MERVLRLKLGRSLWHTLKDLDKEWKKKLAATDKG